MSHLPSNAEQLALRAASVAAIPAITWRGHKVLTTELLAQLYGTDEVNVRMNHSRNAARFDEGIHFFKVSGKALSDLRVTLSDSQISAKARSLHLWTERGAARHAKMIETDQAWDVFAVLEDHYFRQPQVDEDQELTTSAERRPLHYAAVDTALLHGVLVSTAHTAHNAAAGSKHYDEMTRAQLKKAIPIAQRLANGTATPRDFALLDASKHSLEHAQAQLVLDLHDPPDDAIE
ncbi:MAG: ORF6N domain-containing protein [Janthinobacterium svalbardensis]|uniref:KilA-N DNA-binding domain-containing protein n=1 Tax=Janthinobacterium svalbardensis TaxID=368607 RepID=A0A290X044_9BURK|nr:ORF6N domain-containing protein [Janthinobacterium svalbardensis]ATD62522.1 hypothetical protein CNX70_22005 [Janthinobacterium svalbardensis]